MAKRKHMVVTDPPGGRAKCLIFETRKAAKDYVKQHPMERAQLVGARKKEVRRHG